jgi:hypothetical protein
VWSSNSTIARTGNGWEREVNVTAPNGATWTRDGAGSCAGGVCNFGGTVTGPRGNTGTYGGSTWWSPPW